MIRNDTIEIIGRRFPIDVVFAWSDITINKEIGRGNFGRVCQGYLDQGQVQRYLIHDFESWKQIQLKQQIESSLVITYEVNFDPPNYLSI